MLFLVGLGFLVGRAVSPDDSASVDGVKSSPPRDESPVVSRTEDGAVAAAADLARAMTGPHGDEATYRNLMESIAAASWRARAGELAENSIAFARDRYGEGGRVTFNPIRFRLVSYSEDRASVDLWGVVLAEGPKVGGIEESWITGTLQLVWTSSGWKVNGQSSQGGPTPESLRTEDGVSESIILESFEEIEGGT